MKKIILSISSTISALMFIKVKMLKVRMFKCGTDTTEQTRDGRLYISTGRKMLISHHTTWLLKRDIAVDPLLQRRDQTSKSTNAKNIATG